MPTWMIAIVVISILVAAGVLASRAGRDPDAPLEPDGASIDRDELVARLDELDVDLVREQTPPPDLLAPLIAEGETLLDATRAKIEERKALVAILDDRVISVEATLGRMGAQARAIPIDTIDSVSHRTNMGGEVTIEADDTEHLFTHIPLRKFERFVATLRSQTPE